MLVLWLYPITALAQRVQPDPPNTDRNDPCYPGRSVNDICLPERPAGAPVFNSVSGLVGEILIILIMAAGLIATVFVVVGGYKYLTAGGEEEQVKTAKKMLSNALIGLVVVLLAYSIIRITLNLVGGRV